MKYLAAILFTFTLLFSAAPAYAADATFFGPVIPAECNCEGEGVTSAPGWGCVLQVLQNSLNLAISLSVILAVLYIVYSGFLFVVSAGNPSAREGAKTRILNVVVGIVVLLSAWLIVDFIMKKLYVESDDFGPWNAILQSESGTSYCIQQSAGPAPLPGLVGEPIQRGGGTTGTAGCPTCVSLSALGLSCKSSNSCTLDPAVARKVASLKENFSGSWRVTEAYPPEYAGHTNQCHNNGTCIDAGFTGNTGYTAVNIKAFADAATRAGLRPVFETASCALRDEARGKGVTAFCSSDRGYGAITGNHFSVYGN